VPPPPALPSYAPDIFIDVTEDVLLPIGAETIPGADRGA
jgi:hypothetical protein